MIVEEFKKMQLNIFSSEGYKLTPVEFKDVVPFEVKRMYYITHAKKTAKTGQHSHKIEKEVFIQVQGSSVSVIDKGEGKEEILLVEGDSIYVPNYVWHGFTTFSTDAVLIALSSTNYISDRSDYIEEYDEFQKLRVENLSSL